MSKRTHGQVLVLPSQRFVRPAADDDLLFDNTMKNTEKTSNSLKICVTLF